MSTANKINAIINSKEAIKTAINAKGGNLTNSSKLSEYATAINNIEVGGGSTEGGLSMVTLDRNYGYNNYYNLSGTVIYSTKGTDTPALPEGFTTTTPTSTPMNIPIFSDEVNKGYGFDGQEVEDLSDAVILVNPSSLNGSYPNLIGVLINATTDFSGVTAPKLKYIAVNLNKNITLSNANVEILTLQGNSAYQLTLNNCTVEELTIPKELTVNGISASTGLIYYVPNGGSLPTSYSSLQYYYIPEAATQINGMTFLGCSSLKYVHIPATVTTIAANAFLGCSALTEIEMQSATPPSLAANGIPNNAGLVIYVPAGAKTAYQSAANWMNLTIEERA